MCENAVYFLMMIKDYSVTKVLKTTQYYTETKGNAMNLTGTYHRTMNKALSFEVLNVLLSPNNIIFTREGQLAEISPHPSMKINVQCRVFKEKNCLLGMDLHPLKFQTRPKRENYTGP